MEDNHGLSDRINNKLPPWGQIHTLIFDFDGVFTDNSVYLNQDGEESVKCCRGDGLGISVLKKFASKKNWNVDMFILSTESNLVVQSRAKKLNLKCYQGVTDKSRFFKEYLVKVSRDRNGVIFFCNDLNDLELSESVGYSVVPANAHPVILDAADVVIDKNGGEGCVRLFIEEWLGLHQFLKYV